MITFLILSLVYPVIPLKPPSYYFLPFYGILCALWAMLLERFACFAVRVTPKSENFEMLVFPNS